MEENLGMVMGFTVISAALEWLGSTWDTLQLEEEERLKRKKELEILVYWVLIVSLMKMLL